MYGNSGAMESSGYAQTIPTTGGWGGGVVSPPPKSSNMPSGIVDQAAEMAAAAIGEILTARRDVATFCDRLIGCKPEDAKTNGNVGIPSPDGRGHALLANLNALHREISELRNEILRLNAL